MTRRKNPSFLALIEFDEWVSLVEHPIERERERVRRESVDSGSSDLVGRFEFQEEDK